MRSSVCLFIYCEVLLYVMYYCEGFTECRDSISLTYHVNIYSSARSITADYDFFKHAKHNKKRKVTMTINNKRLYKQCCIHNECLSFFILNMSCSLVDGSMVLFIRIDLELSSIASSNDNDDDPEEVSGFECLPLET